MLIRHLIAALAVGGALISAVTVVTVALQYRQAASLDAVQQASANRMAELISTRHACESLKFRAMSWTMTRRAAQRDRYHKAKEECLGHLRGLVSASSGAQSDTALQSVQSDVERFASVMEDIQSNMTEESRNAATARFNREAEPLALKIEEGFEAARQAVTAASEAASEGLASAQRRTTGILAAAGVIGLLMTGLILVLTHLRVVRPTIAAIAKARALAEGNLSNSFDSRRNDEIGHLLQSLEEMRQAWVQTLAGIRASAASIQTATRAIDMGNGELAQRTTTQAAELQQTAAALAEMTATVSENTGRSSEVASSAASAVQFSAEGRRAVSDVRLTFEAIQVDSRRISEMTHLIDQIAFQTNILALNAAVEAARAGHAGSGFAVVASAVRELANRAAKAAKEIHKAVKESVDEVENGAVRVGRAEASMRSILEQSERVAQLVDRISKASVEQRSGIEAVNKAVNQIDVVTQQNVGMVQEASIAVSDLANQAERLNQLLHRFQLPQTA